MVRNLVLAAAALGVLASASATQVSVEDYALKPYHVSFTGKYKLMVKFNGKAERKLTLQEDGSWLLINNVKSNLVKLEESSQFDWREGGIAKPSEYRYKLKAFVPPFIPIRKSHSHQFDYANGKIASDLGREELEYDVVPNLMDRLSHQTALRAALMRGETRFSFDVAEKRGVKTLEYEVLNEEQITTDLGTFNTVVVRRVRDEDSKRESVFWLARDWDYLLIKAWQKEKGQNYELLMAGGELDGEQIVGLNETQVSLHQQQYDSPEQDTD